MHWFLDPVKNHYADFTGRATRQQYWMYILIYILLYIAVAIVAEIINVMALPLLFSLAVLVPGLAITARRLHDIGKSGWWQLIGFVPILGLIVMIIFTIKDSAPANEWGPNPKGEGSMATGSDGSAESAVPPTPSPTEEGGGDSN